MKKYENLFWYREKDTVRMATAYSNEGQAHTFCKKYGGSLVKSIELPFENIDGLVAGFAKRTSVPKELPFTIFIEDDNKILHKIAGAETRTQAFDLLRALAPSVNSVLVVEEVFTKKEEDIEDGVTF